MEWKIGEIRQVNGEWYQCVRGQSGEKCIGCSFKFSSICIYFHCLESERKDHTKVIFKKLEKVGRPYIKNVEDNITYQMYKLPMNVDELNCQCYWVSLITSNIVEIEQTKDMEEKKQCGDNRFRTIARAKEHLFQATNIAEDKKELEVLDSFLLRCWQMGWLDKYDDTKHSNSETLERNLREFDLEAAKAGKPVCTRDGRKARIICFDAKGDQPIIALVTMDNGKEFIETYHLNGRFNDDDKTESGGDLMMLPEKKGGWVNIYHDKEGNIYTDENVYNTEKDAINFCPHDKCRVATVKVEWEK